MSTPEPTLPAHENAAPRVPSQAQQSWGVVISITIIVCMIIIGAFYAWSKRVSQNQYPPSAQTATP